MESRAEGSAGDSGRLRGPIWALTLFCGGVFAAGALAAPPIVTPVAGGGVGQGSDIPATDAQLLAPAGLRENPDGDLYIADTGRFIVQRVDHLTGKIFTIAGTGVFGDPGGPGDGGLASNAQFQTPTCLALDAAGNLFVSDSSDFRVRRIDALTGHISTVAGTEAGIGGDGGPATLAHFLTVEGIALDGAGNLYIADSGASVVRKVNASDGFIHRFAGTYFSGGHTGDGGPALSAEIGLPTRLAIDAAGNMFILCQGNRYFVRRIDAITGVITTVAGGGTSDGSSGLATDTNLDFDQPTQNVTIDISVDNLGSLYIANTARVWKVNLATGAISIIAGGPLAGYSGDGGPATTATFRLDGIRVSGGGDIFLADGGNDRVRKIAGGAVPPFSVIVTLGTTQSFLDGLTAVQGGVYMVDVNGRTTLVTPGMTSMGGDFSITGNGDATTLTVPILTDVGGTITIANNTNLSAVDLSALTSVGGSIYMVNNGAASYYIDSPKVSGFLFVTSNGTATVSIGSPNVTGNLVVVSNGGTVNVGNPVVTGDVIITGNGGGSVSVGNPVVTGDLVVTSNGGTFIVGNPVVMGDLSLTGGTAGIFDASGAQVSGTTTITTSGATTVIGSTGGLGTTVSLVNGAASLTALLPSGAFNTDVVFSIRQVDPATLPAVGMSTDLSAVNVDPIAAYHFGFTIPTLNADATLTFEIDLSLLDAEGRDAFLTALNANEATLGVVNDTLGSTWQTFSVCEIVPPPAGFAGVVRLDSNHGIIAPGSLVVPAFVRFTGLAGHFSTWAVVLTNPFRLQTSQLNASTQRLTYRGPANAIVETNATLTDSWLPAGAPTQQPDGSWQLDVPMSDPQRFYRVRVP